MTYVIAGLIAFFVFSGGLNAFLTQKPDWLSVTMRKIGGAAALVFAAFLTMRGQWEPAIPVVLAGLMLSGWLPGLTALFGGNQEMVTPFLRVSIDKSGMIVDGSFLQGPYQGRGLATLTRGELMAARLAVDGQSASFLEMYLDRRHPGWRENRQENAGAGQGLRSSSGLTEHEAYEILGLQPGATEDMIRQAHRTLMKKIHPDQGGSTYLATRVNQAKDILLSRHHRNS